MAPQRNTPAEDASPATQMDLGRLPKELRDMIWIEVAWQLPGRIFQLPPPDRLPTIGQVPPGLPMATLACKELHEASKKVFVPVPTRDQAGYPGRTVWIGPNDWLWVDSDTRFEGIDLPFRKLAINTDLRHWRWNLACSPSMLASYGASRVHVEEVRVVIVQKVPLPAPLPNNLVLVDIDSEPERLATMMAMSSLEIDDFTVHLTEQMRPDHQVADLAQYTRGFRFYKPGDGDFSWKPLPASIESWFVGPIVERYPHKEGWYRFKWEQYSELLAAVWEENLALLDWSPNRPKVSRCIAVVPTGHGGAQIL